MTTKLGGAPLKYKTAQELQKKLEDYLNSTPEEEWTVTGLAMAIGGKQLLQDYEKRKDFSHLVKQAKLLVEITYEKDLKKHGRAGTIFALKNFGWKDKTETDVTSNGQTFTGVNVNFTDYADRRK